MTRSLILAALLALTAGIPDAFAAAPIAQHAWARATPPGATTGVIYLSLTSPTDDRLTAVATPAATSATLHRSTVTNGVMQMRDLPDGLPLPAKRTVSLQPNGAHIMLEGLKAPLAAGRAVPLHLTFQHAPPEDITATVEPIGAAGPDAMPGMQKPMTMGNPPQ